MKGGHAHEESALIAAFILALIGIIDLFVNIFDQHEIKPLCYFGLFIVLYFIARIWRNNAWK